MSPDEPERRLRRRRRRRGRHAEDEGVAEAPESTAPDLDPSSELEPDAADEEAEDAAADVVLEAEAEAEEPEESEAARFDPDESGEEGDEGPEASDVPEVSEDEEEGEDEGAEEEEEDEEEEDEEEPEGEAEVEAEDAAAPSRSRRFRRGRAPAPEGPKRPAPTRRRRSQRDPSLPPPVVRAKAKYVRSSSRKARLVCDHIRGKSVEEARAILAHTPRAIARDWSKLLESAVANAEHNHELVGEDLYVLAITADDGPTIKRFRPRAMGRATKIRKRTSHLTILLTPKE
jgi:ribosomal protein L22